MQSSENVVNKTRSLFQEHKNKADCRLVCLLCNFRCLDPNKRRGGQHFLLIITYYITDSYIYRYNWSTQQDIDWLPTKHAASERSKTDEIFLLIFRTNLRLYDQLFLKIDSELI